MIVKKYYMYHPTMRRRTKLQHHSTCVGSFFFVTPTNAQVRDPSAREKGG